MFLSIHLKWGLGVGRGEGGIIISDSTPSSNELGYQIVHYWFDRGYSAGSY